MPKRKRKINTLVLFGTRPEVIKLAPVIKELQRLPDNFNVKICFTAQHREICEPFLKFFDIIPDFDLNVMIENQSINDVTIRILERLSGVIDDFNPELIIIQGDTTSAFAASLLGFYRKKLVCHIEAGLRSNDKAKPFPEEMNRVLISRLADIHFAPTKSAREALIAEGIDKSTIFVTGNTGIDSLKYAMEVLDKEKRLNRKKHKGSFAGSTLDFWKQRVKKPEEEKGKAGKTPKLVLVTTHRRESIAQGITEICKAINKIVERHDDVCVLFPMHANPSVAALAKATIIDSDRVKITRQLKYLEMIETIRQSFLVMTDSGGLQEEVPYIGKPIIILRDVTERHEIIENGRAILGGTKIDTIIDAFETIYNDENRYREMSERSRVYGDGKASMRIVRIIRSML